MVAWLLFVLLVLIEFSVSLLFASFEFKNKGILKPVKQAPILQRLWALSAIIISSEGRTSSSCRGYCWEKCSFTEGYRPRSSRNSFLQFNTVEISNKTTGTLQLNSVSRYKRIRPWNQQVCWDSPCKAEALASETSVRWEEISPPAWTVSIGAFDTITCCRWRSELTPERLSTLHTLMGQSPENIRAFKNFRGTVYRVYNLSAFRNFGIGAQT